MTAIVFGWGLGWLITVGSAGGSSQSVHPTAPSEPSACVPLFGACPVVSGFDARWFAAMTGPDSPTRGPDGVGVGVGVRASRLDFDGDRDLDLYDVAEFQRRFTDG